MNKPAFLSFARNLIPTASIERIFINETPRGTAYVVVSISPSYSTTYRELDDTDLTEFYSDPQDACERLDDIAQALGAAAHYPADPVARPTEEPA